MSPSQERESADFKILPSIRKVNNNKDIQANYPKRFPKSGSRIELPKDDKTVNKFRTIDATNKSSRAKERYKTPNPNSTLNMTAGVAFLPKPKSKFENLTPMKQRPPIAKNTLLTQYIQGSKKHLHDLKTTEIEEKGMTLNPSKHKMNTTVQEKMISRLDPKNKLEPKISNIKAQNLVNPSKNEYYHKNRKIDFKIMDT